MSIIGWILFGLIVGVVAKLIMPGPDPGGMIVTILLGIVGALIGGFIGRMLGWYGEGDPVGFVMAVIGRFWYCSAIVNSAAGLRSGCRYG
jgi:uncharacterized membrane protein YeaQ/YmgE (transglycosylase-associated protein family)